MHYYEFNIKSFRSDTAHLSNDEELAYRRLMDFYYDTESPLPDEADFLARKIRMVGLSKVVDQVLREFFVLQVDGWHQEKCDETIRKYRTVIENGRKGGLAKAEKSRVARDPLVAESYPPSVSPVPTTTHYPLPTTHYPKESNPPTPQGGNLKPQQRRPRNERSRKLTGTEEGQRLADEILRQAETDGGVESI